MTGLAAGKLAEGCSVGGRNLTDVLETIKHVVAKIMPAKETQLRRQTCQVRGSICATTCKHDNGRMATALNSAERMLNGSKAFCMPLCCVVRCCESVGGKAAGSRTRPRMCSSGAGTATKRHDHQGTLHASMERWEPPFKGVGHTLCQTSRQKCNWKSACQSINRGCCCLRSDNGTDHKPSLAPRHQPPASTCRGELGAHHSMRMGLSTQALRASAVHETLQRVSGQTWKLLLLGPPCSRLYHRMSSCA